MSSLCTRCGLDLGVMLLRKYISSDVPPSISQSGLCTECYNAKAQAEVKKVNKGLEILMDEEQEDVPEDRYIGTISKHEIVVDRLEWELLNNRIKASKAFLERLVKQCKINDSKDFVWLHKHLRWIIEEEIKKDE